MQPSRPITCSHPDQSNMQHSLHSSHRHTQNTYTNLLCEGTISRRRARTSTSWWTGRPAFGLAACRLALPTRFLPTIHLFIGSLSSLLCPRTRLICCPRVLGGGHSLLLSMELSAQYLRACRGYCRGHAAGGGRRLGVLAPGGRRVRSCRGWWRRCGVMPDSRIVARSVAREVWIEGPMASTQAAASR